KITVKGIITDETGEPLIGASIVEKGTTNGVSTGLDGDYIISLPSNGTIIVSFIGFISQEIPVQGRKKIDIVLKENSRQLDEVVVTALGIKRDRKSLGYALSEVKGESLLESR